MMLAAVHAACASFLGVRVDAAAAVSVTHLNGGFEMASTATRLNLPRKLHFMLLLLVQHE
jgi:hypothetical protein